MIQRDHILQFCAGLSWNPGLHDYDAYGVTLTGLYAVATLITACRAWQKVPAGQPKWFWTLAAFYLLVLTLNKQLDLQTFLTETGRCVARYQGWYGARRTAQAELTFVILGLMAVGLATTLILMAKTLRGQRLMIAGLVLITTYVALRVLSFHHMDSLLQAKVFGQPVHRFIETSAVLVIIFAAALQA